MLFHYFLTPPFLFLILSFPFLTHPLSMGVNLLISVIIISLMIGVFHTSLWISYATVLILLGGLLVIFIYVSLLASNEIFQKNKLFIFPLLGTLSLMTMVFMFYPMLLETPIEAMPNHFNFLNKNSMDWLSDFYSTELSSLTLFLVFYLLLTLLVVVFNTKNNHGTLRSSS